LWIQQITHWLESLGTMTRKYPMKIITRNY